MNNKTATRVFDKLTFDCQMHRHNLMNILDFQLTCHSIVLFVFNANVMFKKNRSYNSSIFQIHINLKPSRDKGSFPPLLVFPNLNSKLMPWPKDSKESGIPRDTLRDTPSTPVPLELAGKL